MQRHEIYPSESGDTTLVPICILDVHQLTLPIHRHPVDWWQQSFLRAAYAQKYFG
jgi:hypothetical protein